ncbi:MAG: pilus assembly FimT family protein [Moraxellaceae bacterium]
MSVRRNQGFTMIELLTAIVIVGVLAAFAVPAFKEVRLNSQISTISGDMAATLNRARSLAITTRSSVYVLKGAGSSITDVAAGSDWASGWRILRGPTMAASTQVSRVVRTGAYTDINVIVSDGLVDATGTASGAAIDGFAFNNLGQLVTTANLALAQAAIVICAPGVTTERGRTLAISRIGRVTNNSVSNPASCGS